MFSALGIFNETTIGIANRIYSLAFMQGLTKTREKSLVCSVCVYIALRKEKTPVMLIEIADLVKVSVFKLGSLFMMFRREFPDIAGCVDVDPSIYISRFAAMLNLGSKTKEVANDALQLVRRMKRDWIADGRRPAGVCGACLLLATRIHGIECSLHDILSMVKMSEITVKKRIREFSTTSAANLTLDEFRQLADTEELPSSLPPCYMKNRKNEMTEEDQNLLRSISQLASEYSDQKLDISFEEALSRNVPKNAATTGNYDALPVIKTDVPADLSQVIPASKRFKVEILQKEKYENEQDNLSDLDDDEEITSVIATPQEVEIRSIIWHKLNREYLIEQEHKKALAKGKPKRKHIKREKQTTEESMETVAVRKVSAKLNRDHLARLFPDQEEEKYEHQEYEYDEDELPIPDLYMHMEEGYDEV